MELGIAYELTGPDGTRVVFGNADAAKADADYVGWLDADSGIAGLDSPDFRENAAELIGRSGGINYDSFHGRRPIVVNGQIDPSTTINTILLREQKLKRATNAVLASAPAILAWTNTGYPRRRLRLLRQGPPRISGRRPKTFQLSLVDSDYRILANTEASTASQVRNTIRSATNAGDELATPRFELVGPLGTQIKLVNVLTGLEVRFKTSFNLLAAETLIVDFAPPYPIVTVNGVNAYHQIDFLPSVWWGLVPGAQDVRVDAGSGAGTWRVFWRDAWI